MKAIRLFGLAAALGCLTLAAPTFADSVLTGELVILKDSPNRFRLVDHPGSFRAPAGVSLDAFDGKPVDVHVSGDGRVSSIEEVTMHIAPIEHGFEIVSGQLIAVDPARGQFSIAGDQRTFAAPAGYDVQAYANHTVEVRLDERGEVTGLTLAGGRRAADAPAFVPPVPLQQAPAAQPIAPSRAMRSCIIGGASAADGISVCRDGITQRCTDGAWFNTGEGCN